MKARIVDMAGNRYAAIVAVRASGKASSGDLKWLFRCDCGNEFEANGYYARSGKIVSCPECAAERQRMRSITHGMSYTKEFQIWTGILTRCFNENAKAFKNYGGRGISVCQRWKESFENFIADMEPRPSDKHSIDRIDNNRNYEPGNCRWATREEQANNKRSNTRIEVNGRTKTISQWAREIGITPSAVLLRAQSGKSGLDLIAQNQHKGCVSYAGITDTYTGWSKRTGIKSSTIAMRLTKYGWPVADALTKGASF